MATYIQSGVFGALGGGMMHSAGRAVDGVKGMVRNRINPYKVNNSKLIGHLRTTKVYTSH